MKRFEPEIVTGEKNCTITVPVQYRAMNTGLIFDVRVCGMTSLFDNLNESAKLEIYRQIQASLKDDTDEIV